MRPRQNRRPEFLQGGTAGAFRRVEHAFYVAVALALALAGVALFGNAVYTFLVRTGERPLLTNILALLDAMLLVFIVTELIHTISAVLRESVLLTEPFLIVGIVALIRRLIVISAEAKSLVGTPEFEDTMLEMGVLIAGVIGLGVAIFLLRHTTHSEPRPAYEPERDESSGEREGQP
jgi:uncharacterized membrane protein (DUF373 family)